MKSTNKPAQSSDVSYVSSILACRILRAMQLTRSLLRWSDDLHKIFVEAVAHQGGPYEAKPSTVKQTMEAMGVTGLTVQNIKSHLQVPHTALRFCSFTPDILASFLFHSAGSEYTLLILVCQRYREKCDLGGQPRQDVLGAASPIMAGHNMTSESEMVMDNSAAMHMAEMEMVDNDFSADEVQMMENELMNEIKASPGSRKELQAPPCSF